MTSFGSLQLLLTNSELSDYNILNQSTEVLECGSLIGKIEEGYHYYITENICNDEVLVKSALFLFFVLACKYMHTVFSFKHLFEHLVIQCFTKPSMLITVYREILAHVLILPFCLHFQ